MRAPQAWSIPAPRNTAARPSTTEPVTCPKPHSSVIRTVRAADQPRARATAANGSQWSGATACKAPTAAAAAASAAQRPSAGKWLLATALQLSEHVRDDVETAAPETTIGGVDAHLSEDLHRPRAAAMS